jgi:hypothetical protein
MKRAALILFVTVVAAATLTSSEARSYRHDRCGYRLYDDYSHSNLAVDLYFSGRRLGPVLSLSDVLQPASSVEPHLPIDTDALSG